MFSMPLSIVRFKNQTTDINQVNRVRISRRKMSKCKKFLHGSGCEILKITIGFKGLWVLTLGSELEGYWVGKKKF